MSSLIHWFYEAMAIAFFLKVLSVGSDFLLGENLQSLIGRQGHVCTVPFLEASLLERNSYVVLVSPWLGPFIIWYLHDINIFSLSNKNIKIV